MAQRITIRIEREPVVNRRNHSSEVQSPDLLIQIREYGKLLDGLSKAIRILTSERDALANALPDPAGNSDPFDEEDED